MRAKQSKNATNKPSADSWLARALVDIPRPTGKPLDGWERHQPIAKGIWYRLENDQRRYGVGGGHRKGWRWWVYGPIATSSGHPIARGYAQHLDYAMMAALEAETLPKIVTLSTFEPVQYEPDKWEISCSGSLTHGTARICVRHILAQQTYAIGALANPGPGVLALAASYITEMSIFYPTKNHWLIHELGQQAIWAYLRYSGQIDENGELCVSYDAEDEADAQSKRIN